MKRVILSTLAAAGLLIAGASANQPQASTAAVDAKQTAQPTDTTSKIPAKGVGQVAKQDLQIRKTAFTPFAPVRHYAKPSPRRVKYGKSRWILMS
ncbi:hypothetical protein [Hymenobacter sp. YC55]|uniref:hypothetical protein n=1 Tax=Hymenobacter sp. YC55 TaxID=3034019 RepID=UPI0023F9C603|nr:hypothetical protein [Hymenobacter sp. YC55]MDF7810521.1 hypothetical protein [Hymenobacter sp. YC55]